MAYCRHTTTGVYMVATGGQLECLGCVLNGIRQDRTYKRAGNALRHLKAHLASGCKVTKAIKRLESEIAQGAWQTVR